MRSALPLSSPPTLPPSVPLEAAATRRFAFWRSATKSRRSASGA